MCSININFFLTFLDVVNKLRMISDKHFNFKHLFAILQFRKPKGATEIPIDLVPGTWVFRSGVDEPWFSKYPPKEDWDLVKEWTKMLKTPEAHWDSYKAKILGHAGKNKYKLLHVKIDISEM